MFVYSVVTKEVKITLDRMLNQLNHICVRFQVSSSCVIQRKVRALIPCRTAFAFGVQTSLIT